MDTVRRYLSPTAAAAVIALIVAAQIVAVIAFTLTYVERGRRIAELEAALCEERVARLARLAMPDARCPDADKILAHSLPQRWTESARRPPGARVAARVVDWRLPPEFEETARRSPAAAR